MVYLKTNGNSAHQEASTDRGNPEAVDDRSLSESCLPSRDPLLSPPTFLTLNDRYGIPQQFYPHIKVHTPNGEDALSLAQAKIPYASSEYRLRSDYLAQTLRIFAEKVAGMLPEGYSVQVSLSPFGGYASTDAVYLIQQAPDGTGKSVLERHYSPFDGGSLGGIIPTDQARNVVLRIEERLFYYTTFLAIKKAIENERTRRQDESTQSASDQARRAQG